MRMYHIDYVKIGGKKDWMTIFANNEKEAIEQFEKVEHRICGETFFANRHAIEKIFDTNIFK